MKRFGWYIIVIALTVIFLLLLWQFSLAILLFGLALGVSAALKPLIDDIAVRSRSRRVALVVTYSVLAVLIVAFLIMGGQSLLQDLHQALDDFAMGYERIKNEWPQDASMFKQTLADQLPSSNDLYEAMTSEEGIIILAEGSGPGQDILSGFGYLAIVLVLSAYWSADQGRFERISVSLFHPDHRVKAIHVWKAVESGVGAYMRVKIIQSILVGFLLGLGYWIIGLRYPALLALWGALATLVPGFGVPIAAIPILFLGVGGFPYAAVLAAVYTVVVLITVRRLVESRFIEQGQSNSLLIVLFIIILAHAFGLIGVLLAPPLAVVIQILLQELSPLFPRSHPRELQEAFAYQERLRRTRKSMNIPAHSESLGLVKELNELVKQTITYLQKY